MECPECGAVASEQDLFCGECGAVLVTSLSEEPVMSPTAEPLKGLTPAPKVPPAHTPAVRDSRANAAFVLGIVSVGLAMVSCIPFVSLFSCIGPVVGITAIILGAVVKRDVEARGGLEEDQKKAQQGLILGIVGTVLYFVMAILGFVLSLGIGLLGEM